MYWGIFIICIPCLQKGMFGKNMIIIHSRFQSKPFFCFVYFKAIHIISSMMIMPAYLYVCINIYSVFHVRRQSLIKPDSTETGSSFSFACTSRSFDSIK